MKKKILLLSDDLRIPSGIGTMSKSFVINSLKDFDWVQMAGAVQHPEKGKFLDLSEHVTKETGIEDASLVSISCYRLWGSQYFKSCNS